MHRENFKNLLLSYKDQIDIRDKFLEFVNTYEDCFERTNMYGHITSSAWLLNSARTHVLLTHHRKLNMWLQPGGHCDGDSDVPRSALRETVEESGIEAWEFLSHEIFDLDVHKIPAGKKDPEHFHFDVRFILAATGTEDYIISEESHDLAWVDLNSIRDFTVEDSILRMVSKTQSIVALC